MKHCSKNEKIRTVTRAIFIRGCNINEGFSVFGLDQPRLHPAAVPFYCERIPLISEVDVS